jgi:hypothetical protein
LAHVTGAGEEYSDQEGTVTEQHARNIVVVGASAHLPPQGQSVLATILSRCGPLVANQAGPDQRRASALQDILGAEIRSSALDERANG